MDLTNKQKKFLRAKAHSLNVVVTIGAKGLTYAVKEEINLALNLHELIKIKLPADDKAEKKLTMSAMSGQLKAAKVQLIGRVGVLYRPANPPVIKLPNKPPH